jgi:hypothetical protein
MKFIKWILIIIAVVVIIPLLVALFVEKDYALERDIVINRPKQEVFDYIKFLKNQDVYSKWNQMDPYMISTYTGTDGTVGFISAWEGDKNVGKGEQEIVRIVEGERVDTQLRFIEPFESVSDAYMITESLGDDQTRVIWGFSGRMSYPMNLFLLIMDMEESIGADYDYGLQKLKDILETEQPEESYADPYIQ